MRDIKRITSMKKDELEVILLSRVMRFLNNTTNLELEDCFAAITIESKEKFKLIKVNGEALLRHTNQQSDYIFSGQRVNKKYYSLKYQWLV